jgi:hypothetical protein
MAKTTEQLNVQIRDTQTYWGLGPDLQISSHSILESILLTKVLVDDGQNIRWQGEGGV